MYHSKRRSLNIARRPGQTCLDKGAFRFGGSHRKQYSPVLVDPSFYSLGIFRVGIQHCHI